MRMRTRTQGGRPSIAWTAVLGLVAVVLAGVTGCQEKQEAPKSASYYSGPMEGKKLNTAQPAAGSPNAPPKAGARGIE